MDRGDLLKQFRPALLLLAVAVFSASAWADGIDPKVIIQKGTGSIPITGNNTSFGPFTSTVGSFTFEDQSRPCLTDTDACVSIVFQNQTSQTLHNLTIAINDILDPNGHEVFQFLCGDASQILFFSSCNRSDNGHVTDINFSGGTGIVPAIQQCVSPTAVSALSCQKQFVPGSGEFGLLIDATADELAMAGQSSFTATGNTLTTPEPDAGIMILSAAVAFGLLKLLRRGA
jgi:hypothetical protein